MGKVICTLGLRSREVRAYGPQEQQILEHLANTVAPAIENAELDDHRSLAETRLRIAEDNYRNVFAYGAVGIYQATPGGIIRSVNSALAQMCGYESPEDLMANVIDFRRQLTVDLNERPETRRLVDEHGSVSGLEQRILRKDGIAIWVSATFRSVRNDNGSLLYYEGLCRISLTGSRPSRRLLKQAGFQGVRLHDARLTHATLMLKQGVNWKIISERLGHGSVAMTLDLYAHASPGLQKATAEGFDKVLDKQRDVGEIDRTSSAQT